MADRLRDAIAATVRALLPARLDYGAVFEAKVIAQSGNSVDVQPRNPLLPPMSGIPLRHGVPGFSCQVQPGAYVLVGFDGPQFPYAFLWKGDETATSATIAAGTVNLGAGTGTQPAVLGDSLETRLSALEGLYNGHVHSGGLLAGALTGIPTGSLAPSPGANIKAAKARVA